MGTIASLLMVTDEAVLPSVKLVVVKPMNRNALDSDKAVRRSDADKESPIASAYPAIVIEGEETKDHVLLLVRVKYPVEVNASIAYKSSAPVIPDRGNEDNSAPTLVQSVVITVLPVAGPS